VFAREKDGKVSFQKTPSVGRGMGNQRRQRNMVNSRTGNYSGKLAFERGGLYRSQSMRQKTGEP
jgi:hypothetical protein